MLISILPLDFHGRLWVIRSMFVPGALHGIEASLFAKSGLLRLRSSTLSVIWSRRLPSAYVGACTMQLTGNRFFGCFQNKRAHSSRRKSVDAEVCTRRINPKLSQSRSSNLQSAYNSAHRPGVKVRDKIQEDVPSIVAFVVVVRRGQLLMKLAYCTH